MTDTITEALERFKLVGLAETEQRKREAEALAFQIPANQWPKDVRDTRKAQIVGVVALPERPMLSFPTLDQPIQLVLNQERSAKLGIEVHPLSEDATDDTAEVLQGLYRRIEVDSRANLARTWAFDRAVKAGRGAYRILTDYADEEGGHPSDQRIVIKRLLHQGAAYFDPFGQEPDWSDGEWAFIVEDMPLAKYKRKFPQSKVAKYGDEDLVSLGSEHPGWCSGDGAAQTVRVAEYFRKVYTTKSHPAEGEWAGRDYEACTVIWSTINAVEELTDPKPWMGKYIPIVPTIGRELQPVEGQRIWSGIIGPNMDAARTVNYSASGMVESAALEPRAPFDIDPEEIEGYEDWWKQSNTRNFPYLPRRKWLHGQPAGPLQRIQADMSKVGMNAALLQMATDQVQRGTGAFDPTLGRDAGSNDSGKKVQALQQQHDQGSGDFLDNLVELSMTLEAKIVLDLIPHIYDRPGRIARILGIEDKPETVMLNQPFRVDPRTKRPVAVVDQQQGPQGPPQGPQPQPGAGNDVKHFDLKKGRYGVTARANKRFESRLQQGAEEIGAIMQAEPTLIPMIGATYFKFRDGPGMREIADILEKVRDQQFPFLADKDKQQDPQQQLQKLTADNQMLKQFAEQAKQALETKQIEQQGKLEIAKIQETAESLRNRENNETKLAVAELGAKVDRLTLFLEERERLGVQAHEQSMAGADRRHQMEMASMGHDQDMDARSFDASVGSVEGEQAHARNMEQGEAGHQQAMQQAEQQAALAPEPEAGA